MDSAGASGSEVTVNEVAVNEVMVRRTGACCWPTSGELECDELSVSWPRAARWAARRRVGKQNWRRARFFSAFVRL